MAEHAARGKKALQANEYDKAIESFTAALHLSPTSPDYLIQRSTAYQRSKDYTSALTDANSAVINAQTRAKRELIVEGQFRRGCALYSLENYADAELVFGVVKRMDEKHKMVDMWMKKTKDALAKLGEGDQKGVCKVRETPEVGETSTAEASKAPTNGASSTAQQQQTNPTPAVLQQTPLDKIRYEWYQSSENVYFTLLAKGVPKDKAQIDIHEHSLSISFPLSTGASYDLTLEPLYAPVKPEKCIPRVLPTKIEIILAKATPGQKWNALESSEPAAAPPADATMAGAEDGQNEAVKQAVFTDSKAAGPSYPTSSKSGPKDWDKVVKDIKKTENPDKADMDDDDDEMGGDEANHFFKKLFKGSSPEVQRAMMKSYTESNGTALSTNWDEVSKGKVETVPPDGMQAKDWEK